uniref:Uncharacterized protein n=1 Tax=Peronospora matthiolae TaxID=2874970 RepID=A0AAV1U4P4_9STRA
MSRVFLLLVLALVGLACSGTRSAPSDEQLPKLATQNEDQAIRSEQDGKRMLRSISSSVNKLLSTGHSKARLKVKARADAFPSIFKKKDLGTSFIKVVQKAFTKWRNQVPSTSFKNLFARRGPKLGKEPGNLRDKEPGNHLGTEPGNLHDKEPGDTLGKVPRDQLLEDPGNTLGKEPGNLRDKEPGNNLGEEPGNLHDKEPGNTLGKVPRHQLLEDSGNTLGKVPRDQLGEEPGNHLGKEPGNLHDKEPGNTLGNVPRDQLGEDPGNHLGKESGNKLRNEPVETVKASAGKPNPTVIKRFKTYVEAFARDHKPSRKWFSPDKPPVETLPLPDRKARTKERGNPPGKVPVQPVKASVEKPEPTNVSKTKKGSAVLGQDTEPGIESVHPVVQSIKEPVQPVKESFQSSKEPGKNSEASVEGPKPRFASWIKEGAGALKMTIANVITRLWNFLTFWRK